MGPVVIIRGFHPSNLLFQYFENGWKISVLIRFHRWKFMLFERPLIVHHSVLLGSASGQMAGPVGERHRRHHTSGGKRKDAFVHQLYQMRNIGLVVAFHAKSIQSDNDHALTKNSMREKESQQQTRQK